MLHKTDLKGLHTQGTATLFFHSFYTYFGLLNLIEVNCVAMCKLQMTSLCLFHLLGFDI